MAQAAWHKVKLNKQISEAVSKVVCPVCKRKVQFIPQVRGVVHEHLRMCRNVLDEIMRVSTVMPEPTIVGLGGLRIEPYDCVPEEVTSGP